MNDKKNKQQSVMFPRRAGTGLKWGLRWMSAVSCALPLAVLAPGAGQAQTVYPETEGTLLDTIIISSEEQLKQALGASTITSEDLEQTPIVNDISEIIRKMPGSNLTGTSASGQRGNQRQIDLRGMGPENTLILIDGKPVMSRNAVRMGRSGERDSRGDSNWVPAEAIERIEVIRGPAAARYGSGASGGVVNIITRRPEELSATVTTSANLPKDPGEGKTIRTNVIAAGPITEHLFFRLIANYNRTGNDSGDLNDAASDQRNAPAGREGVTNKDARGLITWAPNADHSFDFEAAYSRQGNLFAGDSQLSANGGNVERLQSLVGDETNVMERFALAATHEGSYDFGSSESYIQWEHTDNTRLLEGLSGSAEGAITGDLEYGTITLNNVTAKSEWDLPFDFLREQMVTLGGEVRGEWMHDPISIQQELTAGGSIPGTPSDPDDRDPNSYNWTAGLYIEDNISLTDRITLTPGLRADYGRHFGINLSPSLNAFAELTDTISFKAGIARAFKAPNLYQTNPNYLWYSRGNGCPDAYSGSPCYIVGDEDLDPETSINKEIGLSYANEDGWYAGATYFHNDYRNRIATGLTPVYTDGTVPVFQWENVPEAVVSGLEGSVTVPILDNLNWRTNATYMLKSENKQNGQPLSLVPKYTINTWLDWQVIDELTLSVSATHYGETEAPTVNASTGNELTNTDPVDPYTLVNAGLTYRPTENYRISASVNNIFDRRIYRRGSGNNAGANTFNEGGRSFFLSVSATF